MSGTVGEVLRSIEENWNAAALSWNPDALANLYAEDGFLYGGRPDHYVKRETIRSYFESYVGTLQSVRLCLVHQQVIELTPQIYIAQGVGKLYFVLSSGKRTQNELRTTLLIIQQDGKWKILCHHFSPKPEFPPIPD